MAIKDDPDDAGKKPDPEDELPDDPEALKKLLRDEKRKAGQIAADRSKERKAKDALTERMKVWLTLEEAGHTPDEIRQILDQRSEAEITKAKETGNVEKLIANARAQAEKMAGDEKVRREKAESLVQRVLIDDVVGRMLDKYIEPKYKRAVFSLLRPRFTPLEDPTDEYGIRPVVMVGEDYMSADEWLKNWAETDEEASPFLKLSLATGGGAMAGGKTRLQFKLRKDMTAKEKSDYIHAHGLAEYNKLPWDKAS